MIKTVFLRLLTGLIGLNVVFGAAVAINLDAIKKLPLKIQSSLMEDSLTTGLKESAARVVAIDEETEISKQLHSAMKENPDIVNPVCSKFTKKHLCKESVSRFVQRCLKGECALLDNEQHPSMDAHPSIRLPDTFQLEAVYYLFKTVVRHYMSQNDLVGGIFSRATKYILYRGLMSLLMRRNMFFKDINKADVFISRFLYMATLYFKSYTAIRWVTTALQGNVKIARLLLGRPVRRALEHIVKSCVKGAVRNTPTHYIADKTKDYEDYLMKQQKVSGVFTSDFAHMAVNLLLEQMSKLALEVEIPWYMKLTEVIKKPFTTTINPVRKSGVVPKFVNKVKNMFRLPESYDETPVIGTDE
ncbi:rhoptry-associated protein 1, putative [Babesia ovis]|uniref:Rhoptry-associated protein 1, putative n=1 Tax=Babesia ovis TaxID=5869 RepID=A0A9W5TB13_BABOV|nr:rhoptry-associated protein 1, putative [Babesia ovis]